MYNYLKRINKNAVNNSDYQLKYAKFQNFMNGTDMDPPDLIDLTKPNTWDVPGKYNNLKRTDPLANNNSFYQLKYSKFQNFMNGTDPNPPDLIVIPDNQETIVRESKVELILAEPEIITNNLYNTISSRWILTNNGNDLISDNHLIEVINNSNLNKLDKFSNLEFWDNSKYNNIDLSTKESWLDDPDVFISPWELMFVGNESKTEPTSNSFNYNQDKKFNEDKILYVNEPLFISSVKQKQTLSFWFKATTSKNKTILSETSSSKWTSRVLLKTGDIDSYKNRLFIEIVNDDGNKSISKYSKNSVIDGSYHHICIKKTIINGNNMLCLYTDGYKDIEVDITNFNLNLDIFSLGGQQNKFYNKNHFDGDIINVTIWDDELSDGNIAYLAQLQDKTSN